MTRDGRVRSAVVQARRSCRSTALGGGRASRCWTRARCSGACCRLEALRGSLASHALATRSCNIKSSLGRLLIFAEALGGRDGALAPEQAQPAPSLANPPPCTTRRRASGPTSEGGAATNCCCVRLVRGRGRATGQPGVDAPSHCSGPRSDRRFHLSLPGHALRCCRARSLQLACRQDSSTTATRLARSVASHHWAILCARQDESQRPPSLSLRTAVGTNHRAQASRASLAILTRCSTSAGRLSRRASRQRPSERCQFCSRGRSAGLPSALSTRLRGCEPATEHV